MIWPETVLMTVPEIDQWAPDIPCEVDPDETLADVERFPGGHSAWARIQAQVERKISHPLDERFSNG